MITNCKQRFTFTPTLPPPPPPHACMYPRRVKNNERPAFYAPPLIQVPRFSPSLSPRSGKSVVSEPEDEVQATEAGGGGLRVPAEEERVASHKPVEAGDQTGESGGDRRHLGRLNPN